MTDNQQKNASENLLLCLRQDTHQEKISHVVNFSAADWQGVLEQAQRHNLTTVLFWELNRLAPNFDIPEGMRAKLRQDSLQAAHKNMKLYMELRQVLRALNEQDIPNIVLKGAHLAALVYPDISMRTMGDIDILVPKDRLEETAGVLQELGYSAAKPYEIESTLTLRHHLPPFAKPNCHLIEIHWIIFPPTYSFTQDLDGLWQHAQPATISNSKTQILSTEDLLLHLCIHATYQHQFAFGLRALYDISTVLNQYRNQINWEQLSTHTRSWGARKSVFLTLKTCKDLLNAPVPEAVIETLCPADYRPAIFDRIRRYTLSAPKDYSHNFIQLFEDETSTPQKASNILQRIFPIRQTMSVYYGIPQQSPKILLYYPYRLVIVLRDNIQRIWRFLRRDPEFLSLINERKELLELKNWLDS